YRSAVEEAFRTMKDVNISAILDSLQTGYDKRIRPNYGGTPVIVGVTMHILSISSVSEVLMDFTLDFYFRQHWTDPRLSFPDRGGLDELTVGSEYLQKIWVPDTFFANEKKSYFHMATTSNEMLRITSQGNVLRSIRLTITASCPMNLQYFPMDRQLCIIEIESFGYSMDHIRLSWHAGDRSVVIESDVSLPQFRVLGYNRKTIISSTSTGNYSRLLCEIMFVRSMGYYLIQIYIPSSLIVVISWVSFWLNRSATPARVSLGVTTVLTMTTLMSSTNAALPKISYVKSIDVYLGTCFVMVFASLLAYNYTVRPQDYNEGAALTFFIPAPARPFPICSPLNSSTFTPPSTQPRPPTPEPQPKLKPGPIPSSLHTLHHQLSNLQPSLQPLTSPNPQPPTHTTSPSNPSPHHATLPPLTPQLPKPTHPHPTHPPTSTLPHPTFLPQSSNLPPLNLPLHRTPNPPPPSTLHPPLHLNPTLSPNPKN
ncbi:ionotropic GABA receptor beta subunit 1b, partial [Penaeus vannamei]